MSETAPTPGETAQNEAARQAVILLFGIASVLLMVAAQRAAHDPQGLKMAVTKGAERLLARLAGQAWRAAERARVAYERESA
ncbi:MAG TPA: hypothetical protein VNO54_06650 [Streptosporangiaceae bacterium]|nr:hypothetical protein [Streptosporangiaceae bacterium]